MTNREFFDVLETGLYVRALYDFSVDGDIYGKYLISVGEQYIWPGRYKTEDGQRTHALLVKAGGRNIRYVDLDKPLQFEQAFADAESYRRATKYELFLLHCLINAKDGNEQQMARIDALTSEVSEWKADSALLGDLLNEWATEQGQEDDFDREVEGWNKGFHRIHLAARKFEYEVCAKLTVTYDVPLKVTARTTTEADDKLSESDAEEVFAQYIKDRYNAPYPRYDIEWSTPERS